MYIKSLLTIALLALLLPSIVLATTYSKYDSSEFTIGPSSSKNKLITSSNKSWTQNTLFKAVCKLSGDNKLESGDTIEIKGNADVYDDQYVAQITSSNSSVTVTDIPAKELSGSYYGYGLELLVFLINDASNGEQLTVTCDLYSAPYYY